MFAGSWRSRGSFCNQGGGLPGPEARATGRPEACPTVWARASLDKHSQQQVKAAKESAPGKESQSEQ